jgi:hypothetical protein
LFHGKGVSKIEDANVAATLQPIKSDLVGSGVRFGHRCFSGLTTRNDRQHATAESFPCSAGRETGARMIDAGAANIFDARNQIAVALTFGITRRSENDANAPALA